MEECLCTRKAVSSYELLSYQVLSTMSAMASKKRMMKTVSPRGRGTLPDVLLSMMNDERLLFRAVSFSNAAEASEDRWIRWTRDRTMNLARVTESLLLSLSLYLLTRRQLSPVGFRSPWRLWFTGAVGFLSPFLTRASRDISCGAGAFIALYRAVRAAGCLQTSR